MRCIVRNCGKKSIPDKDLCETCFVMLTTGQKTKGSAAWFVTELEFMEQQNNEAMRQIAHLHGKVNELSNE